MDEKEDNKNCERSWESKRLEVKKPLLKALPNPKNILNQG